MELQSPTSNKKPFKLFEHSLSQINNVVIPHRLDMLRKHQGNTEKAIQSGDYKGAVKEQAAAKMLVLNIRRDISEIEALRQQVEVSSLPLFDKAIELSFSRAKQAIEDYSRLGENISLVVSNHEEARMSPFDSAQAPQLMVDKQALLDKDEEQYVRAWEGLRDNIQDLQCIFTDLNQLVEDQGELVRNIEDNTASVVGNVDAGNQSLQKALRYKTQLYPLAGAAVGAVVGGPVGLLIGLKTAGCLALGGSLLGFIGGKTLKKKIRNTADDGKGSDLAEHSSKEHQS